MRALGMQGPPFRSALRVITEKFLKRQIQAGAHDSADDARAAMDLALLKMRCAFIAMCMHPTARRSIASMSPLRMELQMREIFITLRACPMRYCSYTAVAALSWCLEEAERVVCGG